jgi:hypothetical protein
MSSDRLAPELDDCLVDTYRAWHAWERAANGLEIIDFDLAKPRTVEPAQSRAEVSRRLDDLLTSVAGTGPMHGLVRQRLNASLAYLRALDGERMEIDDYIRVTLGTSPVLVSEEAIAARREAIDVALNRFASLHREATLSFRAEDFPRFQSLFRYPDPGNLPRLFEFYRDKWLPVLLAQLKTAFDPSMVRMQFASEDAYWKNWISGNLSEQRVLLRINYHPRHTWYQGAPETLVLHEYCGHAVQMASWHARIVRNEVSQFSGILTVHFPDQFIVEGLAEALIHVLPDGTALEPEALVIKELNDHSMMVWNNVHLIANREGPAAAEAYAAEHLPFSPASTIRAEIRDRTTHPLFRTYQYVYGIALEAFLAALRGLPDEEQWALLRRVYEGPMMPDELLALRR